MTERRESWRNWGDHPVTVSISTVAGLAGIVACALTITGTFNDQRRQDTVIPVQSLTVPTASREAKPGSEPKASREAGEATQVSAPARSTAEPEVVAHDVSLNGWNEERSMLRIRDGLRELSALESGRRESAMPKGTYGHVSPPEIGVNGDWKYFGSIARFASTLEDDWSFEVHRRHDGVMVLLGFLSETAAETLESDAGKIDEFVLSPVPAVGLTSLIVLPLDRIKFADSREAQLTPDQSMWVLDVKLK